MKIDWNIMKFYQSKKKFANLIFYYFRFADEPRFVPAHDDKNNNYKHCLEAVWLNDDCNKQLTHNLTQRTVHLIGAKLSAFMHTSENGLFYVVIF